jgi:hypothetical protein
MNTVLINKFNARDIYQLFSSLYQEKYNIGYKGVGFIGNEMHGLREILDEHGAARVACATINCIDSAPRTVNIPYFVAGINSYLVPYNLDVYWAVKRYSTPEIQRLWKKFLLLDSVWFPSATKRAEYKVVLQKLQEWAHEKTGKKTRKTNSKI